MTASLAWEVIAQDMFDREAPVTVDARGVGQIAGLEELWRRTLTEGVHDDGVRTFTAFRLRWEGGHTDIGAQPFENFALARIRTLVYGAPGPYQPGGPRSYDEVLEREDRPLLQTIADTHAGLLVGGEPYDDGSHPASAAGRIRAVVSTTTTASELTTLLRALSR